MKKKEFKNIILEVASKKEGVELISNDYFNSFFPYMTSIDIEIRIGKSLAHLPFNEQFSTYINFIKGEVLDFSKNEILKLESCFQEIDKMLGMSGIRINPQNICLIKSTGREEGTKGYTRNNCIIIPEKKFAETDIDISQLKQFLTHELFHVYSRYNPTIRFKLYNEIGFRNDEKIFINKELNDLRITNPDAANFRFRFDMKEESGNIFSYVPFIYSNQKAFDPFLGLGMFGYIETTYYRLDSNNCIDIKKPVKVRPINGHYELHVSKKKRDTPHNYEHPLYETISRNSGYIIHPEEIIADNFSLLLLSFENPAILSDITPLGKKLQVNLLKILAQ